MSFSWNLLHWCKGRCRYEPVTISSKLSFLFSVDMGKGLNLSSLPWDGNHVIYVSGAKGECIKSRWKFHQNNISVQVFTKPYNTYMIRYWYLWPNPPNTTHPPNTTPTPPIHPPTQPQPTPTKPHPTPSRSQPTPTYPNPPCPHSVEYMHRLAHVGRHFCYFLFQHYLNRWRAFSEDFIVTNKNPLRKSG